MATKKTKASLQREFEDQLKEAELEEALIKLQDDLARVKLQLGGRTSAVVGDYSDPKVQIKYEENETVYEIQKLMKQVDKLIDLKSLLRRSRSPDARRTRQPMDSWTRTLERSG